MTFLTTRAVHFEVVQDFSTKSKLNCLFRFIARRGKPDLINSDNGRKFVGKNNHLQEKTELWLPKTEESMAKRYSE